MIIWSLGLLSSAFKYEPTIAANLALHHHLLQVCLLLSTGFHLFFCLSERAYQRWLILDLLGVSVGLLGIYLSGIRYSFYCHQVRELEPKISNSLSRFFFYINFRNGTTCTCRFSVFWQLLLWQLHFTLSTRQRNFLVVDFFFTVWCHCTGKSEIDSLVRMDFFYESFRLIPACHWLYLDADGVIRVSVTGELGFVQVMWFIC